MQTANSVRISTYIVGVLVHVFERFQVLLPSRLNDKNRAANPTCTDENTLSANARFQGPRFRIVACRSP